MKAIFIILTFFSLHKKGNQKTLALRNDRSIGRALADLLELASLKHPKKSTLVSAWILDLISLGAVLLTSK